MSKLFRDEETNAIKKLRVTEAVASYAHLVSPQSEGMLKAGKYGVELIIRDEETIALIKEYAKETALFGIKEVWGGKQPKSLTLPYKQGDEEREREAGAFILKTTSSFQPNLLIRDNKTGRATHLTEEEKEEYYSGMLIDADVTFKPYTVGGNTGIVAYVNTVCKVGDGEPFATGENIEDSFSIDLGFEDEDSFDAPVSKPTSKTKTVKDKVVKDEAPSLEDLVSMEAPKTTTKKTTTKEEPKQLTIDDLLA